MLDRNQVLDHVKEEILAPWMALELSDDKIFKEINNKALQMFSKYIPDKTGELMINPLDVDTKGDNKHRYKMIDPDGRDIISITEIIFDSSELFFFGHGFLGVFNFEQLPGHLLSSDLARAAYDNSIYKKYYTFRHPNIIEISDLDVRKPFKVLYERKHSENYDTIPHQFEDLFLKLAAAVVKIKIGSIRSVFTNINTQYGTVELNGQELKQEGREERREVEEELKKEPMNIIIDFG